MVVSHFLLFRVFCCFLFCSALFCTGLNAGQRKLCEQISGTRQFLVNSSAHRRSLSLSPSALLCILCLQCGSSWPSFLHCLPVRHTELLWPKSSEGGQCRCLGLSFRLSGSCLFPPLSCPADQELAPPTPCLFSPLLQELLHYLIGTLLLFIASIVIASKNYNLVAGAVRCF